MLKANQTYAVTRARRTTRTYTGVGKSRFTVVSTRNTDFILVLLFIY
jgi:hypothetical protein